MPVHPANYAISHPTFQAQFPKVGDRNDTNVCTEIYSWYMLKDFGGKKRRKKKRRKKQQQQMV